MTLNRDQKRVLAGMLGGMLMTIASFALGFSFHPPWADDRLLFIARVEVLPLLILTARIGTIAKLRFFSKEAIHAAAAPSTSHEVEVANAILQNTLEQIVLAFGTHAVLTALLPPDQLGLVVALVFCWVVGRLTFWAGYTGGAATRAFGFATTFYPTVAGLGYAAILVVRSLI